MAAASAADKRRMLAELANSRRHGDRGSFVGRGAAAAAVGVTVLLAILWYAGWFTTPRAVREARAIINEQIAVLERAARNEIPMSEAAVMTEASLKPVYERMRDMPQAHRDQVRRDVARVSSARHWAEINSFFALPPQQRQAELDRRIRAEEERRRAWQASRERADAANGGAAGAAGGSGGPQAATAPSRGQSQGPRWTPPTDEQRLKWRKQWLDHSSPDQRARLAEYNRLRQERRKQLAAAGR